MQAFITGFSLASALGSTPQTVHEQVRLKRSGITFNHRFSHWTEAPLAPLDLTTFGLVADEKNSNVILKHVATYLLQQLDATTSVFSRYEPHDIAFLLGTTTAGVQGYLDLSRETLNQSSAPLGKILPPETEQRWLMGDLLRTFACHNVTTTISASCISGALAIAEGAALIQAGIAKACIVGGLDVLTPLTIKGFESLQVVDPNICRPFDPTRAGINLGEGGALLLLEAKPTTKIYGKVLGTACISEAHHMTHPLPGGEGIVPTIRAALDHAAIKPAAIDYINAHGTGTLANDSAEALALAQIFGAHFPFESTKNLTGHTLAGAGALEAVITLLKLQDRPQEKSFGLSNSFGFGGGNMSLVLAAGVS